MAGAISQARAVQRRQFPPGALTMEPSLLTILLLGFLEGLTEFLPVSSTGHLILAAELLGFTGEASSSFKIAIQLGAILAVIVAYHRRFGAVLAGLARRDPPSVAFTRNIRSEEQTSELQSLKCHPY